MFGNTTADDWLVSAAARCLVGIKFGFMLLSAVRLTDKSSRTAT